MVLSRDSAVFYLKSANLIGSPTVFYLLIENDLARVALQAVVFLDFWLFCTLSAISLNLLQQMSCNFFNIKRMMSALKLYNKKYRSPCSFTRR